MIGGSIVRLIVGLKNGSTDRLKDQVIAGLMYGWIDGLTDGSRLLL